MFKSYLITSSISFFCFIGLFFLLPMACTTLKSLNDPLQAIKDEKVKEVLNKAFKAMGGVANWQSLQALQFQKKTNLYFESGTIEQNTFQNHTYQYQPKNKVQITWDKDQKQHQTILENGKVQKTVNGQLDTQANATSLKNGVLAATFVVGVPFKLLDDGVQLTYDGTKQLPNGQTVEVIKAVYDPTTNQNHTKPNTWWHYFDTKEFHQVGYMIRMGDHNSYVENLTYDRVGGFLFTRTRKSWRVDDNGEKLYLRADYEYTDYQITK